MIGGHKINSTTHRIGVQGTVLLKFFQNLPRNPVIIVTGILTMGGIGTSSGTSSSESDMTLTRASLFLLFWDSKVGGDWIKGEWLSCC